MVVVVANRAVEMRDGASLDFVGQLRRIASNVKTYAHRRRVEQRLQSLDDRKKLDNNQQASAWCVFLLFLPVVPL